MQFQQTDATNASSIQELPVLNEMWFFGNWELPLQRPQDATEHLRIFLFGCIIAREMDIDAPASQLRVDFPKGTKVVGAYQNVTDPGQVLEIFQVIELVLKSSTTGSFGKVMGLVYDDSERLAMEQRGLHGFSQFPIWDSGSGCIHKGVVQAS